MAIAKISELKPPDMQSVLIGSEYPVMDTLLFYVKNGEKLTNSP